ncbi:MAG: PEP-CTERM sorting domain-containing protein [Gammaproteobacteria bacterium]
MRKKLQLLVAFGLALATGVSNAALLSVDWQKSGDGLLTRDTATHLEWLDLEQTFNQTVATVLPLTAPGQIYHGFRLASVGEVHGLMTDGGVPFNPPGTIVSFEQADFDTAYALTALLGETLRREFGDLYYGSRGQLLSEGAERVIGYYVTTDPAYFVPPFEGPGLFSDDFFASDCTGGCATTGSGVWLVRATPNQNVPEPSALGLLGIGFLGMAGVRRRKGGATPCIVRQPPKS